MLGCIVLTPGGTVMGTVEVAEPEWLTANLPAVAPTELVAAHDVDAQTANDINARTARRRVITVITPPRRLLYLIRCDRIARALAQSIGGSDSPCQEAASIQQWGDVRWSLRGITQTRNTPVTRPSCCRFEDKIPKPLVAVPAVRGSRIKNILFLPHLALLLQEGTFAMSNTMKKILYSERTIHPRLR